MRESYPARPAYFAHRLIRLLQKSCAANAIGIEACWLITCIALVEDSKRYSGPVTFWNGQLLPITGFSSWGRLDRARAKAIEAGWLHYNAGTNRQCGAYWTMIPPRVDQAFDDLPIDQMDHHIIEAPEINHQNRAHHSDRNVIETGSKRDRNGVETVNLLPVPLPLTYTSGNSPNFPERKSKRTESGRPGLTALSVAWNEWQESGIVRQRIRDTDSPGKTITDAWDRGQRDPEQRSRLTELDALRAAIVASQDLLLPATWFDFANLIGGKNSNRRWYAEQLLAGAYHDRGVRPEKSDPQTEVAWKQVLNAIREHRFPGLDGLAVRDEQIRRQVGDRSWQALQSMKPISIKQIDTATKEQRIEFGKQFAEAYQMQQEAVA